MDNDYILSVIREYPDKYLKKPVRRMPRDWFKQISYSRWAVDEILKRIQESKSTPPVMVVEEFIRKMDDFSCGNRKNSIIFSIAHDMAEEILDALLAMK